MTGQAKVKHNLAYQASIFLDQNLLCAEVGQVIELFGQGNFSVTNHFDVSDTKSSLNIIATNN